MKKINSTDIEGFWRSEDSNFIYDLAIRSDLFSVFSKISKKDQTLIINIEGIARLVFDEINSEQSIWIGDQLEFKIYHLRLPNEFVIELSDKYLEFIKLNQSE